MIEKDVVEEVNNEENGLLKCRHLDCLELWHRQIISQCCPMHSHRGREKKVSYTHRIGNMFLGAGSVKKTYRSWELI